MRRFSAYVAIFLLSGDLLAQTLEPGLWKSRTTLRLNGIPMPDSRDENCVSGTQAHDARSAIEEALKKQGCFLTKWEVKNKNLNADVRCDNQNLDAAGKLTGVFNKKSYSLQGDARGKYKRALPSIADFTLSGEWVADKDCEVK